MRVPSRSQKQVVQPLGVQGRSSVPLQIQPSQDRFLKFSQRMIEWNASEVQQFSGC